jgi:hypothetical protein
MFLLDLRSHYTNQANLTGDHIHTPPKWGVTSSRGGLRPPPRNPRLARLAVTRGAHRSEARHPNPPPATPGSNRRNTPSAPARLTPPGPRISHQRASLESWRGILRAVLGHPPQMPPAPHRAPRTHPEADNSPRQFPAFLGDSPCGLVTSRQAFVRRCQIVLVQKVADARSPTWVQDCPACCSQSQSRLARLAATGGQVRPKNEGSKTWTPNYRG